MIELIVLCILCFGGWFIVGGFLYSKYIKKPDGIFWIDLDNPESTPLKLEFIGSSRNIFKDKAHLHVIVRVINSMDDEQNSRE